MVDLRPEPALDTQSDVTRIELEYFAILREHTGRDGETWHTQAGSVGDLYAEIAAHYGIPEVGRLKAAINDEFADWHAPLSDGDRVVFIPPVAGG
ncbi:MAG: MoaD/ThiS family protein [Chromatiales bacterium]|nr:MoaD/ThiS family protein [Chromatiales bacterium]